LTVTFQSGQFFHPYYGWFDKEPYLPNYAHRSGLVNEKIGAEHFIGADHQLYDVAQKITQAIIEQSPNSKMAQRLAEYDPTTAVFEESPAAVYEHRDLSYYLDGTTKFAGSYAFVYEGNTMTVQIDFQPHGTDPIDVVAHYEEHRAYIQNLKKQGFHDDTINMLMKALDDAFVNMQSGGFEGRLLDFRSGMSSDQTKGVVKAFYEEYLRVRDSAGSMINAMITAGNALKSKGLFDPRFDVTTPDQVHIASSPEHQKNLADLAAFTPLDVNAIKDTTTWDPADTHIRNIDQVKYVDYSKNTTMSDVEKEARSLSIIFRVRGDQTIDYARRYEEIMGQLDSKLSSGEISAANYNIYRADLDTAFIKTHNLNIKGQAMAAGLSEEKAIELAMAFSDEYIKIRNQTAPGEINADKIANAALQKLASQGWPAFSLYSSENRAAVASNDPWYAMMAEDALYWQSKPQSYAMW